MNIPLFRMHADDEDIQAVSRVISSRAFWAGGPQIELFEKAVANYIGSKFAVAFNSGTSALHAMMLACGIGAGDEVIVPSFTFVATANASLIAGAKPVFAEIEDKTYGLDADDAEKRITKNTKAIMPMHYAGCPCRDIAKLKDIAERRGLLLLEDAAQSFGARIGRQMAGTFGNASIFSFCHDKIISTGEGGMALTGSKEIYDKLLLLRSHGREPGGEYSLAGFNLRLSSISAALGLSQLRKAERLIEARRENARVYDKLLAGIEGVGTPKSPARHFHAYQKYTIHVPAGLRGRLQEQLASEGIASKVYFEPVHLEKLYRDRFGFREGHLPVTEAVSQKVLSLPMFPGMSREEICAVADSIKKFMCCMA